MTSISNTEWLAHLATSWTLFGLIWTIQLSHYPSFKFVDEDQFSAFHLHHTRSISLVVMPLMLLELGLVFLAGLSDQLELDLDCSIGFSDFDLGEYFFYFSSFA